MTLRRPFTPAEDAAIIRAYPHQPFATIAAKLGRSYDSVQVRSYALIRQGRLDPSRRFHQPRWTAAQTDYLLDHWGALPDQTVARHLGRTVNACKIRATRFHKLARSDQFYTSRGVADIFGIDSHLVIRWIERGWLTGRRSPVSCGGNRMWSVSDAAIARFIRRYPWVFDRTRIERGSYWRNLADRVWTRDPYLTVTEAGAAVGVGLSTIKRHIERGWLRAERVTVGGGGWGYRIARSQLAGFTARHATAGRPWSEARRERMGRRAA